MFKSPKDAKRRTRLIIERAQLRHAETEEIGIAASGRIEMEVQPMRRVS